MPEWLQQAIEENSAIPLQLLAIRLVAALLFGFIVAGIYHLTMRGASRMLTGPFLATLVLLSVVIAIVTLVIGNSVARAFSLVGALAIVRFRTVVDDTRDTAFVIFSVVVGMAAGAGSLVAPLVGTPLIFFAAWLFRPRPHTHSRTEAILTVRLASEHPPGEKLQATLQRHIRDHRLIGMATARGGTALDVTWIVAMPAAPAVLTFVQELTQLEGVLAVEIKED